MLFNQMKWALYETLHRNTSFNHKILYNCRQYSLARRRDCYFTQILFLFSYIFFCHLCYSVTARSCRHVPGFMGTKGISEISWLRSEICIIFQIIYTRAVYNNCFIIHSKSFFEGIFFLHINFVYSCQLAKLYYDHWESKKTKNDCH